MGWASYFEDNRDRQNEARHLGEICFAGPPGKMAGPPTQKHIAALWRLRRIYDEVAPKVFEACKDQDCSSIEREMDALDAEIGHFAEANRDAGNIAILSRCGQLEARANRIMAKARDVESYLARVLAPLDDQLAELQHLLDQRPRVTLPESDLALLRDVEQLLYGWEALSSICDKLDKQLEGLQLKLAGGVLRAIL